MNGVILRILSLLVGDLVSVYGSWILLGWGYRAVGFGHHYSLSSYLEFWPIGVAFVTVNAMFRLYQGNLFRPAAPVPPPEELRRLVLSALLTHLGLIAVLAFVRQSTVGYSRFVIAAAGLLTGLVSQALRDAIRAGLHRFGVGRIPVALIGPVDRVEPIAAVLADDDYVGFRPVARFGEGDSDVIPRCRNERIRILVSCQDLLSFRSRLEEYMSWFSYLEHVQTSETIPLAGSHVVALEGLGTLEMVNQRRFAALRVEKLLLDAVLSVVAFILLLPVSILIALAVKLTSKGPVLYRHERLGQGGRPIRVWKFRSMYVDADARLQELLAADPARKAEWEANFKLTGDPRVTPFGRILRKTSLDEIPQLLNVFAGEMSLIGPRPIVEKEVPLYGRDYTVFSSVRPGITGLWQTTGRSDVDYARRVALDVHYVLNWSPWLDLWILFRTVFAVVRMKGAF